LNVTLGDPNGVTTLVIPRASSAENMSVFVGETMSEAGSYPVFDTVVQICASFDPPKLWLYVRDGVIDVSLFQIGN
jgi:hypothetical protein